jgi:hypothetical protein
MDLAWIGFFFLLRPSKYLYMQKGSCPFRLQDIVVRVGEVEFRGNNIPLFLLDGATIVGLEFKMQKNGIAGELIGLANTTDPSICPVKAITCCIAHLRKHGGTANTPLSVCYDKSGTPRHIADRYLTQQLQIAASPWPNRGHHHRCSPLHRCHCLTPRQSSYRIDQTGRPLAI